MAEYSFDHPEADFDAETELLRGANTLPTLSSRLRACVLDAAMAAYRQARRWAQARQAASFLSTCLLASFVLSPLADVSFPRSEWDRLTQSFAAASDIASLGPMSSPNEPNTAWTLRNDREFLGLPLEAKRDVPELKMEKPTSALIAHSEVAPPRDKLLAALQTSDGWATVQAFQAVRTRSHSTLQRAFAAN